MSNNSTKALRSGYDLAVYGLADNTFYEIHIPVIVCICISQICAVLVIVLSFRQNSYRTFFTKWGKSERFVVYLAICDGLFNSVHVIDHMHIVIVRDHVRPPLLCQFYGFVLTEFITAQNLMVNVVAINAFMLMYFDKNLNFGRWDWRLLLWTFGTPFVGGVVAWACDQLGPNGVFCYFDAVKGKITNIFFTTVLLLVILVANILLYMLTWIKLRKQTSHISKTLKKMSASMKATHKAARSMSMFVLAFFIQWFTVTVYGTIQIATDDIPQGLFQVMTVLANIGGLLNFIVFLIIRKKQFAKSEKKSDDTISKKTGRVETATNMCEIKADIYSIEAQLAKTVTDTQGDD